MFGSRKYYDAKKFTYTRRLYCISLKISFQLPIIDRMQNVRTHTRARTRTYYIRRKENYCIFNYFITIENVIRLSLTDLIQE